MGSKKLKIGERKRAERNRENLDFGNLASFGAWGSKVGAGKSPVSLIVFTLY